MPPPRKSVSSHGPGGTGASQNSLPSGYCKAKDVMFEQLVDRAGHEYALTHTTGEE